MTRSLGSARDFGMSLAAILTILPFASAQADLRVVAEVQVTRSGDPARSTSDPPVSDSDTQRIVFYFKGDKAREEDQRGSVTLYDLRANRVYHLTPSDKRYTSRSLHDDLSQNGRTSVLSPAGRSGIPLKTDVKVNLKKDSVVGAREYAGKQANLYNLSEVLTTHPDTDGMEPRRSSNGGLGGRRGRRGGGFPGGGFPMTQMLGEASQRGSGGGYRQGGLVSVVRFDGEIWLTDTVIIKSTAKRPLLPFLIPALSSEPALNALSDKIAKAKAFPVAMKITVSQRDPRTDVQTGTANSVRYEVKELSEEPLDDALFKIPADYALDAVH